jgi:hypothetical protein
MMIFSKKIRRLINVIALFAITFASLAPTISHALSKYDHNSSFTQEICNASGQKIFIEVVTSKGKQLQASLDKNSDSHPANIAHHIDHCPFCHAGVINIAIPSHNPAFELYLAPQVGQQCLTYQAPISSSCIQTAHLTRAPPLF